jgi:hypothetical protein
MAHTTKYGNTYSDQEWKEVQEMYRQEGEEARQYFEVLNDSLDKAAAVLHKEFSDTPEKTWRMALAQQFDIEIPREVKFTSEKKAESFEAAVNWISSELK